MPGYMQEINFCILLILRRLFKRYIFKLVLYVFVLFCAMHLLLLFLFTGFYATQHKS
ncbi:MAG: hypothetical protein FKGGLIKP_00575 [Sodalis sp. Fse]|nr:MAG: hypothetical protein FKGGLIKP_00575 [Sodalis sp. Fse]